MQMIAGLGGVEPPRMSQLSLLYRSPSSLLSGPGPQPTPLCLSHVDGEERNGFYLSHL